MDEENRQKMITAMQMMQEACQDNTAWADCEKCPFDSFCTALQRAAVEIYDDAIAITEYFPMDWEPDKKEDNEDA